MIEEQQWVRVATGGRGLEVWRRPEQAAPRDPATPPLVVLSAHGIEDSWRNWRLTADELPQLRWYSAQLPWHGGNTYAWRDDATPGEWLARALDLIDEPVDVLVGHSFGANATLELLAYGNAPSSLRAVFLAAPFYRPAGFRLDDQLKTRSKAAFRRVLVYGLGLTLGARARTIDPEIRHGMERKLLERAVPRGFPVFYREFARSGEFPLSGVTVPTLIVAGVDDESLTPMRARALGADLPAATVRLDPRYTHFCHVEQAPLLAADLRDHLSRVANDTTVLGLHALGRHPAKGQPTMTQLLDEEPTRYVGRPRYEGANIRTWIGFKHFMYLVEEAVLQYFRDRGVAAHDIYHRYGLGLQIVDSSVQLPVALEAEEQVYATVVGGKAKPGLGAPFVISLIVERDGQTVTVAKGKVRVALVRVKDGSGEEPPPAMLAPFVVPDASSLESTETAVRTIEPGQEVADVLAPAGSGTYLWSWRAPYYYCQMSDRLAHSAYVRTLEEVVDRFLYDQGLAIGALLAERSWIPVVSRARVQLLSDAWMEETVHTTFRVEEILRDTMYAARMDCWVRRGDQLERTATGTIMHGYAISRGELAGTVAVLDDATQAALRMGRAA